MKDLKNNSPSFDFTVEGFKQLRKFSDTIEDIDDKIKFFEQQIENYGKEKDVQAEPDGINFTELLQLELDHWKYIVNLNEKIKIRDALKYVEQKGDSFSYKKWIEQDSGNYLIKTDFNTNDLFDFNPEKLQENICKISPDYNLLIYIRYFFKEFVIQTTLYPESYLELQKDGFRKKVFDYMIFLKDRVDIDLYNEIGQLQTDLENALSQEKYSRRIFIAVHSRYEIDDENLKIDLKIFDNKKEWHGSKTDLVEECIRKFVKLDFETLMEAFRWAEAEFRLKGSDLRDNELYDYYRSQKTNEFFKEENGNYYRMKKGVWTLIK